MTELLINEIHIGERPSNNTSKDADVSLPKEVNIVSSSDTLSVQKDTHLSEDIQTEVGGNYSRNYENNKVGLTMEAKDKSTTETLVVSDEKLKSDMNMMCAKEGSCCLDTRVEEEDLKVNTGDPTSEVDLKVVDDEQSNFKNLDEEKTKSIVSLAAEAQNREVRDGQSRGDLKDILVDNPTRDSLFPTEEYPLEVKNQTFLCKETKPELINKIKEDKAKQPIAVMITTRHSRKKPRGKLKSSKTSVALNSRKSSRSRSTSVAAEKFVPRKMTRRKSTGSCNIGRKKKSNCSYIIEHNLYLKSHSAEFRKRINNVKSRLFKETKSFVAYKSARHKEAQERRNRVEEIARKTKYLYADRSIDFSKKSKRQREDMWRRKSNRK